ncbi:heat shock 70 kDa protein 12B [Podospora fimiseda]|uniref:Heat shock 70 kDa protein 12B n=1 Tax=Podospora fimiseda TaxID=252190 RepID=A0AAN7BQE7_9PEZI|nr:heat shock 70 kDa protein 12B [Podospora fimiseda]
MSGATLCFGIDFGTTFSGVSWSFSGKPSEIHTVTKWPTKLHRNSDREKTPTEFCLITNPDGTEQVTWGYDVPLVSEPFRWFKLLLVEKDQLPEHLHTSDELAAARKKMEQQGLTPVELVAKYLGELWKHTIKHVTNTLSENAVNECRFQIVLTVPAIWRDAARQKMTEAAEMAGILVSRPAGLTTLDLVSEPEAGALSTFSSMEGRPDIAQGDSILVVDAGGGTVDLISYTVESLTPFRLSECVEGSGGLCGAVFVDRSFQNFLRTRLTFPIWDNIPSKEMKKFLNSEWEHGIKQEFAGEDEGPFFLDLPPSCSGFGTELVLESGHVKEIFDHVVEDVIALVWQQIKGVQTRAGKPPKYVILVGGFGRCQYLGTSIRKIIDPGQTSVLQGAGAAPWTAVCRGAVLHGLNINRSSGGVSVQVSSRIARAHYGIALDPVFKPGYHDESDKYWDALNQVYRAENQMDWYVLKGDDVLILRPKTRRLMMTYGLNTHLPSTQLERKLRVYASREEPPPSRMRCSTTIHEISQVHMTCPVRFQDLPLGTNQDGTFYRRWYYQVKVITNGSSASVEVYDDDLEGIDIDSAKMLGTKRINVDCGHENCGEGLARLSLT